MTSLLLRLLKKHEHVGVSSDLILWVLQFPVVSRLCFIGLCPLFLQHFPRVTVPQKVFYAPSDSGLPDLLPASGDSGSTRRILHKRKKRGSVLSDHQEQKSAAGDFPRTFRSHLQRRGAAGNNTCSRQVMGRMFFLYLSAVNC